MIIQAACRAIRVTGAARGVCPTLEQTPPRILRSRLGAADHSSEQLEERDDVGLVLLGQDLGRVAVEGGVGGDQEERHVVTRDILETLGGVVVEVGRRARDSPQRRDLEG